MTKRRLWGLGVVLAGALACTSLAVAGAGTRVSQLGRGVETPALGVDARGDQTLAWTEQRGTRTAQYFWVLAATRSTGKHWGAPVRVSQTSQDPIEPVVAVNASGAAVIAWIEVISGRHTFRSVVVARTRPSASASWRRAIHVASATGSLGLQAGIDARGDVTLLWSGYARKRSPVMSAIGSTATGRWHKAHTLGQLGVGALSPELAVNGRGGAVVAWARAISRSDKPPLHTIHYAEMARYRPAGHSWGRTTTLGRLALPDYIGGNIWSPPTPDVVLDDRGEATVMWQTTRSTGTALLVAHRTVSGNWTHPHLLAPNSSGPLIGSDAAGAVTIAWTAQRGRLVVVRSDDGRTWSRPATIPGATDVGSTWLSVGPRGNAILTWFASHTRIFVSTRRRADGRWTRPSLIGHGVFPQAGLDRAGTAALVWLRTRHVSAGWVTVLNAATQPTR